MYDPYIKHIQNYHRQILVEYQRMSQVATEYERKHVYRIQCGDCQTCLTDRGMSAVLLSDRSVQLFSTDLLPDTVAFVHGDYAAASCSCRVRDIACLECGNVVGYHVNVPCKLCLSQPNNGHYWMFRSNDVYPQQIYLQLGPKNTDLPLLWGFVRDAGDFAGGFYRSGGAEAAHKSCQLAVRFASTIPLIVQKPRIMRVYAQTFHEGDEHYTHIEKCR